MNFVPNFKDKCMDVITMEATAYKELIRKIEKIADYVFKKRVNQTRRKRYGWIIKKLPTCYV